MTSSSSPETSDLAQTDPYVFADDDQLIFGGGDDAPSGWTGWVDEGVKVMRRRPEYGILAGWGTNFYPGSAGDQDGIMTVRGAVGSPCFVRRGAIGTFPDYEIGSHDFETCGVLRSKGIPFGLLLNCRYTHLGHRYSQVSPMAAR